MSDISYFQRYSQRENHITNAVLLMMRMLYRSHPHKLQKVLEGVFSSTVADVFNLHVGPVFEQQVKSSSSIPDAKISQQSFNLLIEVKPGEHWNEAQLIRHLKSASDHKVENTLLLLLSTDVHPKFGKKLRDAAESYNVSLVSTTFDMIIGAIEQEGVIAAHETDLRDILDDFKDLLSGEDLLEDPFTMFAFGCSQTLDWNLEHKMYFDHISRPSKAHVLTGFYSNRKIHALGNISATVVGNPKLELDVEVKHQILPDKELIKKVKQATKSLKISETDPPLRWYIYDEIHKTDFRKSTPYGYFQGVWFYLGAYTDEDYEFTDVASLAEELNGQYFGNDRGFD